MAKQRDAGKAQWWQEQLDKQAASGLSVREFCRRETLGEASFYHWRRELASRDGRNETHPSVKVPTEFAPVTVRDPPQASSFGASITLVLPSGLRIELPESTATERLAQLANALEVAP